MNPMIKWIWLVALKHHGYQASSNGCLSTPPTAPGAPTTYSSLGVLRELAIDAGIEVEPVATNEFRLPPAVAKWAKISDLPWMKMAHPSGIHNLAYLNKLGGGSFDLEAAAIREHL